MKLQDHKKIALKNPDFKKEYERYDLAFEIGQMVLEARLFKGITQQKLAEKLGTKQPSVARLENGQRLPSLSFLEKVANAFDTYLLAPRFAFLEKAKIITNSTEAKTVHLGFNSNSYVIKTYNFKNVSSTHNSYLLPV
jgi:transcriptional regulator with XRE-family HTH domain